MAIVLSRNEFVLRMVTTAPEVVPIEFAHEVYLPLVRLVAELITRSRGRRRLRTAVTVGGA
ncbi:hypothetical protein AB0E01_30310 [Nocardia vinacea]|uniref:hypothetical protein n=1 Tax=Nocardia vinacea TaxID=96468 RepID=UPI003409D8B1